MYRSRFLNRDRYTYRGVILEMEASSTVTHIRADTSSLSPIGEIWKHRELLFFLSLRDVKVRYKQTLLGVAWALIQPLAVVFVFTIFFGYLAKVPSAGAPYHLFALAGLIPWTFFANTLGFSSSSLITDANLLRKVYFPKLILPLTSFAPGLIDLLLSLSVLCVMLQLHGALVFSKLLLLPLGVLLLVITTLGASVWLSALTALYRDFRYLLPFIIQLGLFLSPVAYSSTMIPEQWQYLYAVNPMVGVIESFRFLFLDSMMSQGVSPWMIAISLASSCAILGSGLSFFARTEKYFADIV